MIDIRQVPMFNENYKGKIPEVVADIDRRVSSADAVIIASPEYNHSVTSALKSVIEWLSYEVHPLENKPVMIIGASTHDQGSSRSQVQLRDILISPGVNAYIFQNEEFFMSDAANIIDKDGDITNETTIHFLEKCMREFKHYAKAIDRMGKTLDGTSTVDFDPEEVKKGQSIYTAIAPVEQMPISHITGFCLNT